MGLKCKACGAKIRKDDCTCPACGYVLYTSAFSDIANEVDEEMKLISDDELLSVAKEMRRNENKLTLEEFEQVYLAKTKKRKPIQYFRNIAAILIYEKELKKAYKDYLAGLGYDWQ